MCRNLKRKRGVNDEINKDIERKEEELRAFKELVHKIDTTISCIEERLLRNFDIARKYEYDSQQQLPVIADLESLNSVVQQLGSKYVESVLLTVEGKFVLVTQLEIYCKHKDLDSCANLMIKCLDDVHKTKPVVSMDIKNEGNGGWYELRIFFDQFELLVTGGVIGSVKDKQISAFLGSSRAPDFLVSQHEWFILSLVEPAESFQETRRLRNYQKKASLYRWSFKSQRFADLGFQTCAPLRLHLHSPPSFIAIASYLIDAISKKEFGDVQKQIVKAMLLETSFLKDLGLPPNSDTSIIIELVEKLLVTKRKDRKIKIGQ